MSKRFGRNQKRKFREEIKNLKVMNVVLKKIGRKESEKAEYLEGAINKLGTILKYSTAFTPELVRGNPRDPMHRVEQYNAFDLREERWPPASISNDIHATLIDLKKIEVSVRRGKMKNPLALHIHVRVGNGTEVGYYVSGQELEVFGIEVEYLSRKIAEELNYHLTKGRRQWKIKKDY